MPSELRLPNSSDREVAERSLEGEGRLITTEVVLRSAAAAAAVLGVPRAGWLCRSLVFCEDAYDEAHACTHHHEKCH